MAAGPSGCILDPTGAAGTRWLRLWSRASARHQQAERQENRTREEMSPRFGRAKPEQMPHGTPPLPQGEEPNRAPGANSFGLPCPEVYGTASLLGRAPVLSICP